MTANNVDTAFLLLFLGTGPYIPTWMEGAASWHPSVPGHRMRGAHHAYFWLLAFRESIRDVIAAAKTKSVAEMLATVQAALANKKTLPLPKPIHTTNFADNIQCFTDYEPRIKRSNSLTSLFLPSESSKLVLGLIGDRGNSPHPGEWHSIIYEQLVDRKIITIANERGYLDFKHMIYGDVDSGPISFKINAKDAGTIFVCETPGIWNKFPDGFDHLWTLKPKMFITKHIDSDKEFTFVEKKGVPMSYTYKKEMDICVSLDKAVDKGTHALTIVPTTATKIILAFLMFP